MSKDSVANLIRRAIPRSIRNSVRSPSKSFGWLWDSGRFALGGKNELRLDNDMRIICHPRAYKVARAAQFSDPEQREEFQGFLRLCSKGMHLFDLGAHFGLFSLVVARYYGAAVAVDPSPIACKMIETQARLNDCAGRIRILQTAVSDAEQKVTMVASGVFSDGYFKVAHDRPSSELETVNSTTIDSMAVQFGAPTHIKIDVEGHEAAVLRGARSTLSRASPILFVELHNHFVRAEGGDPNEALDELQRSGYRLLGPDGLSIGRDAVLAHPICRVLARRIASA
jgi:FkbM family methyltransferase